MFFFNPINKLNIKLNDSNDYLITSNVNQENNIIKNINLFTTNRLILYSNIYLDEKKAIHLNPINKNYVYYNNFIIHMDKCNKDILYHNTYYSKSELKNNCIPKKILLSKCKLSKLLNVHNNLKIININTFNNNLIIDAVLKIN